MIKNLFSNKRNYGTINEVEKKDNFILGESFNVDESIIHTQELTPPFNFNFLTMNKLSSSNNFKLSEGSLFKESELIKMEKFNRINTSATSNINKFRREQGSL